MASRVIGPVVLLALSACGDALFGASSHDDESPPTPPAADAPDADVDAGVVNAPQKEEPPPNCDVNALPYDNACVVDESLGIFVSKSLGSDAIGSGTRAAPYASLGKAIASAAAAKKRVYACAENYPEAVAITAGVAMFGELDCVKGWSVDATKHAMIAAPTSPAVRINGVTTTVRLDGFDVDAPAGSGPAQSSIAIIVAHATDATIANAHVRAKDATAGNDGVEGPTLSNGPDMVGGANVNAEPCTGVVGVCRFNHRGAAGGTNACAGASGFSGGPGGSGGFGGEYAIGPGVPPQPYTVTVVDPPTDGEVAGALTAAGGKGTVHAANGSKGASGANGASSKGGAFTENGFKPGDGAVGGNGGPGQGGGGGIGGGGYNGSYIGSWFGVSGAGGGAGGCPGIAGTAGKGGGASVGVLVFDSKVRVQNATIESATGGKGGRGTLGSLPTNGAGPGANNSAISLAGGGAGGMGGESGVSGHGAGGPSVAIAYKGAKPDVSGSTLKYGTAGKGQAAVNNNNLSHPKILPASADGVADTVYAIP